jgi:membrane-associated phospholipid phosphatase
MPLAIAGLMLAWGVMLLLGGMELDRGMLLLGHAGDRPELSLAARWLTELGGAAVLLPATALGAALLAWRRDWRDATLLVAITLSGRLLVELQKAGIGRLRPETSEHLVAVSNLSFPSGHAANSAIVWLSLALLLPRTAKGRAAAIWAAVWLTLAIGVTRVMLGVHWPSDVIGGWSFGLAWTLLLLRLSGHRLEAPVRSF